METCSGKYAIRNNKMEGKLVDADGFQIIYSRSKFERSPLVPKTQTQ